MSLADWIARLLTTAALLGGFPPATSAPPVQKMTQAALATMVCGGPCPVLGAYMPGAGIFLSDGLDLDASPEDRSVLLHELVHYLQDLNRRYADEERCDRYRDRELQAYAVQDKYLDRYNLAISDQQYTLDWQPPGCAPGATIPIGDDRNVPER